MLGLIVKDLMNLKKTVGVYALFIAFYFVVSFVNKNAAFLNGMVFIFSAMLPITAMSYDERAKWDKYALTMPVSRRDMVISKYLLGLVFMVIGLVFSIIISLTFSKNIFDDLMGSLLTASVGIGIISLAMPILFKLGVEKGRLLMMLVFLLPAALIILLPQIGIPAPSEEILNTAATFWPMIIIAVWIVSLLLSIHIYKKKEF